MLEVYFYTKRKITLNIRIVKNKVSGIGSSDCIESIPCRLHIIILVQINYH